MPNSFGELMRKARKESGKTLGDVARFLGVSVVYVSDIERGQRKPLAADKIVGMANFLNSDARPLLSAADNDRGFIEYELATARPLAAHVVGELVAGLQRGGVSEKQLEAIDRVLKSGGDQ